MELTFDAYRYPDGRSFPVYREDGSQAYTIKTIALGSVYLHNAQDELIGTVDPHYNMCLGSDVYIGQADHHKGLREEWYQIHYYDFWTAERSSPKEDFQVRSQKQGRIGTIRRTELGWHEHRYTLTTEDPRYFLMMLMLALNIYMVYHRYDYQ